MPRSLAATVRRTVDTSVRARGESYFRRGRVSNARLEGATFRAVVRGSRRYDVSLTLDGHCLTTACDCPYVETVGTACKHVWAVVLAADEQAAFDVPAGLWLDVSQADDPGIDDVDPDEEPARGDPPSGRIMTAAQRQAVAERMRRYWEGRRRGRTTGSPAPKRRRPVRRPLPPPPPPAPPAWQTFLTQVTPPDETLPPRAVSTGELIYVLDLAHVTAGGGLRIDLMTRTRKKSGEWGKPRTANLDRREVGRLPDERDRRILDSLCGAGYVYDTWSPHTGLPVPASCALNVTLQREIVPDMCRSGRLLLRDAASAEPGLESRLVPIDWDDVPVRLALRLAGDQRTGYTVDAAFEGDGRTRPVADAALVTHALILWRAAGPGAGPRLAPFDAAGAERWLVGLIHTGPVTVPGANAGELMEKLALSDLAPRDCPDELRVETVSESPRATVRLRRAQQDRYGYQSADRVDAALAFVYGDREVDAWSTRPVIFDPGTRRAWRRDREAEQAAVARLLSLGARRLVDWQTQGPRLDVAVSLVPALTRVLLSEGWHVEAEGRLYRSPASVTLDVRTGIDWFELHGHVDFGGVSADLPALLAAARRGDAFVPLGDGTFGLLPEEWLSRSGRLASLGAADGDHVRFARSQAALLDAWLASQPEVSCDEAFGRARAELARFEAIVPGDAPPTFRGTLRAYQRDALGWFDFLRRFGFGGCLADEMGLGKTIMVLAALEARRLERVRAGRPARPALVVVPRSLVFNWRQEAEAFAPALRVLDLTGSGRGELVDRITEHDVVLATYGTLRRDIGRLKEVCFDYAILDEAQAIKNARTNSAKAARLLQADHRLALSGTPVENHLGELWSLLDFLNPGSLGSASMFAAAGSGVRAADDDTLALVARGVRPFILRRTKDQVASELPSKTEQTLYCDLERDQRALYVELRDHYRAALLSRVARGGLGRAKLQVLEALLRLRQAACHPGLIDKGRAAEPSAKLDVLLPRLHELAEDGRKVLVFSQFTSLLALLRARLDEAALAYEYLDGRTRDRAACVRRFQENGCPLFLISLKAGGHGLNLTAAEYVFLLDPWWNPAVEAQAVDRAHRIGQTKPVFAFRLIARDTVEEKVLELQTTKRRLADAIVRADQSLIRDLRREDLELLLS